MPLKRIEEYPALEAGGLQVQVLSEKLSGHLSSYQDDQKGNGLIEALGTEAHQGWVSKPTGRNMCEA